MLGVMKTRPALAASRTTQKVDLKKELKPLYAATSAPRAVDPGLHSYLMIDGAGDPNVSPAFKKAVEALFSVSYHLKFSWRKETGVDYGVMPLEGLWWTDDMATFSAEDKMAWSWTLMILQPSFIERSVVEKAVVDVAAKKGTQLDGVRYETFDEGKSAQVLHVGPFSAEGPTVQRLHEWIVKAGGKLTGKHHEIYLSDFRRGDPTRWKTIVRQPFEKARMTESE